MNKQQIFKGLNLTIEAAKDLALYWDIAGDGVAVIDSKGMLTTSQGSWMRPMAHRNFKVLREALRENEAPWVIVQEHQIIVNFAKLAYNEAWLKGMFKNRALGVCDSEDGLKLYQRRETYGEVWYEDLAWILYGVTVASLGLEKSEVLSLTPNSGNPDEAEWKELFFAA